MSVSAISGQSDVWSTLAAAAGQRAQGTPEGGAIAAAAKALGMSQDDVLSALKGGQSLDDLAQQQGISHDDLVASVKAALPQSAATSGKADGIAEKIVDRKGLPHHHRHGHRPAPATDTSTPVVTGPLGSVQGNGSIDTTA